jgi:hypothetical protein
MTAELFGRNWSSQHASQSVGSASVELDWCEGLLSTRISRAAKISEGQVRLSQDVTTFNRVFNDIGLMTLI